MNRTPHICLSFFLRKSFPLRNSIPHEFFSSENPIPWESLFFRGLYSLENSIPQETLFPWELHSSEHIFPQNFFLQPLPTLRISRFTAFSGTWKRLSPANLLRINAYFFPRQVLQKKSKYARMWFSILKGCFWQKYPIFADNSSLFCSCFPGSQFFANCGKMHTFFRVLSKNFLKLPAVRNRFPPSDPRYGNRFPGFLSPTS